MRSTLRPGSTALARRALAAASCAVSLVLATPAALAHGGHAPIADAPTPAAPPGEGATAERVLREVTSRKENAALVAEPVASARAALERAHGARTSGDTVHARMLEGLAREWAETAARIVRAAAAERAAVARANEARATASSLERMRTLLEETQGRLARAAAELLQAQSEANAAAAAAAAAERARVDGKPRGAPSAKRGGGGR